MTTPNGESINHVALSRSIAEESLKLGLVMNRANEIQWEASPIPKPREDTSQRSIGGHSDPTGDIVLDARRLSVREAFVNAERAMVNLHQALLDARENLEEAVEKWNG